MFDFIFRRVGDGALHLVPQTERAIEIVKRRYGVSVAMTDKDALAFIEWIKGKDKTFTFHAAAVAQFSEIMKKKIGAFAGRHAGERCAILANGWSFPDQARLDRIPRSHIVIGTNTSAHEVEEGAPFLVGRYHVIVDENAAVEYGHRIPPSTTLFARTEVPGHDPIVVPSTDHRRFSWNLQDGWTVAGASPGALQLAVFMGFTEIVFVALDLQHEPGGERFHYYRIRKDNDDPKAATPEHVDFATQLGFMETARQALAHSEVSVINTSPDSAEDQWERVPFDEVFPK